MDSWDPSKSAELYGTQAWGAGYFSVSNTGNIIVSPDRNGRQVDLFELVQSLTKRGIQTPVLFRFDGIIRDRINQLNAAFAEAIQQFGFQGNYQLAFPIKVNQQRQVVDSVRAAGKKHNIGLEVGSKPELLAVLAIHDTPQGLLLCNGYKDSDYIELALLARKLGRRSIIIVEQASELEMILKTAERLGICPEIGLRVKPANKGAGKWEGSAGEGAKFGLDTHEIVSIIHKLKERNALDIVKLMHFHIGSQITAISAIRRVLKEAARFYGEIAKDCKGLCFFDVGGGLGVDYDGSKTNFDSSMNYTLEEYARDVVWEILTICKENNLNHPTIVSESGRAVIAHHAVLVTEVIDVAPFPEPPLEPETPPSDHESIKELTYLYKSANLKNCQEVFNDAVVARDEIVHRFVQGDLNLEERAYADKLISQLWTKLFRLGRQLRHVPEDIAQLEDRIRDTYFCNFSVFQSLPDSWAINQLFPIMPIHNLQQEPTRRAVLADMTCDSDGKIDRFIDIKDTKRYLKLHRPENDKPYYIGAFIVGAYQEILGDLHNLFGDTNAVHVDFTSDGQVDLTAVVEGDTMREVLSYVQFNADNLFERLRGSVEQSLREGVLTAEESAKLQRKFKECFEGYTYLMSFQEG